MRNYIPTIGAAREGERRRAARRKRKRGREREEKVRRRRTSRARRKSPGAIEARILLGRAGFRWSDRSSPQSRKTRPRFDSAAVPLLVNPFGSMDRQVPIYRRLVFLRFPLLWWVLPVYRRVICFFILIGDGSAICPQFGPLISSNLAAAVLLISVVSRFSPCISVVCSAIG